MPHRQEKRAITIVSACMTTSGTPAFVLNEVQATPEEIVNGVHYYLAEAQLLQNGYEEPFVHFDENEAPTFLIPAVKAHLSVVTSEREAALPF